MKKVPLSRPDHPDDPNALLATLREIVLSGRWSHGEYGAAFERRVAELCGAVYAVATNSGGSALDAICAEANLGVGDEVVCPAYTHISTIHAVLARNARPVFADIEPETFNLDLADVERKITPRTRALILVHQFGIPSDGARFARFCQARGILLLEDAACALGSRYGGKPVGTSGLAGLLSFHPRKVLSTGEGGMVLTDNETLERGVRKFGNYGQSPGNSSPDRVGHSYRMSEFQAALGLWALDRLSEAVSRRAEHGRAYLEGLSGIHASLPHFENPRVSWNYQSYPIRIPAGERDAVAAELAQQGIETNPGPTPVHLHPYIVDLIRPPRLAETERAYEEVLLLPMYAALKTEEREYVIRTLRQVLA